MRMMMTAPAPIRSRIASQLIGIAAPSPRNAPNINSAIAPAINVSSGRTGSRSEMAKASFMGASSDQQGRGLGRTDRLLILADELGDRGGRQIQHGPGEHPEQDGQ